METFENEGMAAHIHCMIESSGSTASISAFSPSGYTFDVYTCLLYISLNRIIISIHFPLILMSISSFQRCLPVCSLPWSLFWLRGSSFAAHMSYYAFITHPPLPVINFHILFFTYQREMFLCMKHEANEHTFLIVYDLDVIFMRFCIFSKQESVYMRNASWCGD